MTDAVLDNEPWARFAAFAGIFVAMALWEVFAPRRTRRHSRRRRWSANLGVLVLDAVLVRLVFPAAAVGFAIAIGERGWVRCRGDEYRSSLSGRRSAPGCVASDRLLHSGSTKPSLDPSPSAHKSSACSP